MRSPVLAMLWENWRLTRVEVAWRLALGIVGGGRAGAVRCRCPSFPKREAVKDFGAASPSSSSSCRTSWVAVDAEAQWRAARLSASSPLYPSGSDGRARRRPDGVPHRVAGGDVPALGASPGVTFGYAFPLLSVAAWIAALNLVLAATNWSTPQQGHPDAGSDGCRRAWVVLVGIHRLTQGDPTGTTGPEFVADALRLPARRLCPDRRDWPGIVRSDGRRGGAPAPRRCAGAIPGMASDSRTGSSACSGSRVPPRPRRGRRCGSS